MPRVPYNKPALTHAAHLQQLKNRGLQVESDAKALHLLEKISYYRLSGYWYPMLAPPKTRHVFKPGSTFNNAFKLYRFDRELRTLLQGELEKIEVAVRAHLIYTLSHKYGSFWYTNSALFHDPGLHATTIAKISQEYRRTDEKFITDFKAKYSDPMPPSWMMLELTSFGSLSMLYKNLKSTRDKRDVANSFGLDHSTFESWLHTIVYVRNVCAHHCRFWNRIIRIAPQMPLTPANAWISVTTMPDPASGAPINLNNRAYVFLSLVIYLLNVINPKNTFRKKFSRLLQKYSNVDVAAMGFPSGWEMQALWDWKRVSKSWFERILEKCGLQKIK